MHRSINTQRIQHIQELLMCLATGEELYQIERTEEDDGIEALLVLLNLITEEIGETLRYINTLNIPETPTEYVNLLFVLDNSCQLQHVSPSVYKVLRLEPKPLEAISFSSLLSSSSLELWKAITQDLRHQTDYHAISPLSFRIPGNLTKTCTCSISRVSIASFLNPFILITTFETSLKRLLLEEQFQQGLRPLALTQGRTLRRPHILTQEKDIRIIQNIRDYILHHLEEPLPGLRALAHLFGTNEYKLKYGFNQLYGTSVFRFLTQERLKRARLLLQNTSLSIKTIAQMTGFKNVSHFSKAFKKHHGIRPMDLKNVDGGILGYGDEV